MKSSNILLAFKFPRVLTRQPPRKKNRSPNNAPEGYHINPRYRAFGRARLDLAQRIHNQEEWETHWKAPTNPYPFTFSPHSSWKYCIVYYVVDFAAEIGFWIDMIGLTVNAIAQDYVQFSSPEGEISFAVATASDQSTASSVALRLQFQVENFSIAIKELERRNIHLVFIPEAVSSESNLTVATFTTPNGIPVDIWGEMPPLSTLPISSGGKTQSLENTEIIVDPAWSKPGLVMPLDKEVYLVKEWDFTPFDEDDVFTQTNVMEEPAGYKLPTTEPVSTTPSTATPKSSPVESPARSSPPARMGLLKTKLAVTSSPDENQVETDHFEEKLVYEPLDQENDDEVT